MPVRRLRSLDEAEEALWYEPGDPRLWEAITEVWALAETLCPRRYPPGVYKHRTIESANRLAEAWEAENVRAQARRARRLEGGVRSSFARSLGAGAPNAAPLGRSARNCGFEKGLTPDPPPS